MLPPHAPPEYADRNTLWNAAEVIEKQWNSQLARRFVLAIPRELPREQYAHLIRDYCREFLVSKGMIADFDIHDKWGRELSRPYPAKKAALLEALEQAKEPTIPELLSRYLDMRGEERTGWTSKGKLKGTVGDFNKVMEALDFLRQKEISTVESLDAYLDKVSGDILAANRYFKAHPKELPYDTEKLKEERAQLAGEISEKKEGLRTVQEYMKRLKDVRLPLP